MTEDAPTAPINPYGRSKLATEWLLRDSAAAHDLRYVALRCFNVAGADPDGRAGQSAPNAADLITVAAEAAAGLRDHVTVFGADHDTGDGTCVRDFVHVSDVAAAMSQRSATSRTAAATACSTAAAAARFSVREVLAVVQAESGSCIEIRPGPRRGGDPPVLVSDPSRLQAELGWSPRYDDLGLIVRDAVAWQKRRAGAGKRRTVPAPTGPAQ